VDVLSKAYFRFGHKQQLLKLIEEMSELTQAISKELIYHQENTENIIEEMADVQILIDQFRLVWGGLIDEQMNIKKKRLSKIMKDIEKMEAL
jgi:NTP pyrophosphatase (non-canonical NTP hydrolase)